MAGSMSIAEVTTHEGLFDLMTQGVHPPEEAVDGLTLLLETSENRELRLAAIDFLKAYVEESDFAFSALTIAFLDDDPEIRFSALASLEPVVDGALPMFLAAIRDEERRSDGQITISEYSIMFLGEELKRNGDLVAAVEKAMSSDSPTVQQGANQFLAHVEESAS